MELLGRRVRATHQRQFLPPLHGPRILECFADSAHEYVRLRRGKRYDDPCDVGRVQRVPLGTTAAVSRLLSGGLRTLGTCTFLLR